MCIRDSLSMGFQFNVSNPGIHEASLVYCFQGLCHQLLYQWKRLQMLMSPSMLHFVFSFKWITTNLWKLFQKCGYFITPKLFLKLSFHINVVPKALQYTGIWRSTKLCNNTSHFILVFNGLSESLYFTVSQFANHS